MELDGEQLDVQERVVVSPATGVFMPLDPLPVEVEPGSVIGHLLRADGLVEVCSPFAGRLAGMLALRGERVQSYERIAWLRLS